jgi:peptidoglycan/xylan/chitin deacetylase (PgdA/CDA1 family)
MLLRTTSIGLAGAAALLIASCHSEDNVDEHTCTGSEAISYGVLNGDSLPPKTLALTFDDGPGARTLELSAWLRDHGVRVAFFVNGKNVWKESDLAQIASDGHLIANHTQTHRSLTGKATGTARLADWDVQEEIKETDALIAPYVDHGRFLFRPPYGDWDGTTFSQVDGTPMEKYVGPVLWNIGDKMTAHTAADWDCWQPASDGKVLSVDECGALYFEEIQAKGHGIVLMHDFYFRYNDPSQGGSVDMVKGLVPQLLDRGYTFVRVDEVPDVASKLPPLPSEPAPTENGARAVVAPRQQRDGSAGAVPSASASSSGKTADPSSTSGGKPDPCRASPHDLARKSLR